MTEQGSRGVPLDDILGEQRWREGYADGAALTFAQAIDSALAADQAEPPNRM